MNAVDRERNTALMAAVDNRNDAMHMWTLRACVSRVKCVAFLLGGGADVNRTNKYGQNALDLHIRRDGVPQDDGVAPLLLVAGERLQGPYLRRLYWDSGGLVTRARVPHYLRLPEEEGSEPGDVLSLQHACRHTLRRHLTATTTRPGGGGGNLFVLAPRLGLPPTLTQYLLYNTSLTVQCLDDDDDDDDVNNDVIHDTHSAVVNSYF